MPYTELPIHRPSTAGVPLEFEVAQAGGHYFKNTGREIIIIKNVGLMATTASFLIPMTVDGEAVDSKDVFVDAATFRSAGRFPTIIYNQVSGDYEGCVLIDLSSVVSISLVAVQMPAES